MMDEMYYDDASDEWIVQLWTGDGSTSEVRSVLTDEQEIGLNRRAVYACTADECMEVPFGEPTCCRVKEIGDIVAEAE